jgi:hypothetical protein
MKSQSSFAIFATIFVSAHNVEPERTLLEEPENDLVEEPDVRGERTGYDDGNDDDSRDFFLGTPCRPMLYDPAPFDFPCLGKSVAWLAYMPVYRSIISRNPACRSRNSTNDLRTPFFACPTSPKQQKHHHEVLYGCCNRFDLNGTISPCALLIADDNSQNRFFNVRQTIATATNGPDPRCGKLSGCYLVNIETNGARNVFGAQGDEMVANGPPLVFDPTTSSRGWSIKCDKKSDTGDVDYVKYRFGTNNGVGQEVNTHFSDPFYINGDNSGTYINEFDYISDHQCLGTVSIGVTYYSWRGGDDFPCGSFSLQLKSSVCTGSNPCAGKTPNIPSVQCINDEMEMASEQSGVNVTKGYQGDRETIVVPITTTFSQAGLCPVNVSFFAHAYGTRRFLNSQF